MRSIVLLLILILVAPASAAAAASGDARATVPSAGSGGADLVVTDARVPFAPAPGEWFPMEATIANEGARAANASFTVVFRIDGVEVARETLPPGMPAGYVLNVSAHARAPANGTHVLAVEADVDGNVTETSETNNAFSRTFTVSGGGVDLVVEEIMLSEPVYENASAFAGARFGNRGTRTLGESVTLAWFLDDVLVRTETWPAGMPPGWMGESTLRIPPLAAGEHALRVEIDLYDNATETSETNNTQTRAFTVRPRVEATVEIVSLEAHVVDTPQGPAEHPLGRHTAVIRACAEGEGTFDFGHVSLTVYPGPPGGFGSGLPGFSLAPLPGGSCVDRSYTFDAHGYVGDFTLQAMLHGANDLGPTGNVAHASGHRLVAGHGGAGVPFGARQAPGPEAVLVDHAQRLVADLTNATGNGPLGFLARFGFRAACGDPSQPSGPGVVCENARGDYGYGGLRGCREVGGFPLLYHAFHPDEHRVHPFLDPFTRPLLEPVPPTGIAPCDEPTGEERLYEAADAADAALADALGG